MRGSISYLSSKEAISFLLPRHYSGRVPTISKAFGWIVDGKLQAVCTFGKPASPYVCEGLCGKQWSDNVYELNRLCRNEDFHQQLSQFVSACLRRLRAEDWIVVSYSDTAMHHNGYVYQACNFMFTGQTEERTDIYHGNGKHARHYSDEDKDRVIRQLRSPKNRYVYFCTFKSNLKKKWKQDLKYPILPYPKAENQNYILGQFMKPILVNSETGEITTDNSYVVNVSPYEQESLFYET